MANTRRWITGAALSAAGGLALALPTSAVANEADLVLPDLSSRVYLGGSVDGWTLLLGGLVVCALGLAFGLIFYRQLERLPVHRTMREVSELIYATCKTYLLDQGKFILVLWAFIAAVIVAYFGFLSEGHAAAAAEGVRDFPRIVKVPVILAFSLLGIAGSYLVAWFGIRINTFANSRTSMASLKGLPFPCYSIPLKAGMSIGMVLISVELLIMLCILLFVPRELAGPCFIGFAIGESLGAAALRVAGGIFTKIADIGADLMKIVFGIKEDDARNPGVIADCTGDNAGDSVGPTADGFETYGVTGVALITFIMLAVPRPEVQVDLLVWIFAMRVLMVVVSGLSYFINEAIARSRFAEARHFDFEKPLTSLVWITSLLSIAVTYAASFALIPNVGGDPNLWWELATIITCGTFAGAIVPEVTKIFTSTGSTHVKEVVTASREGGASLNVLSGLTAGNFSAFWVGGVVINGLMAIAYAVSLLFPGDLMLAPAVFAFGLVAFGFLGMGPVTIAVDSYGPVTDNAQSVYELSLIEQEPDIVDEIKREYGYEPDFEHAKFLLEENDGAGNTFKATAKPVLIGTAVVGATTMIFSIVVQLAGGVDPATGLLTLLPEQVEKLSILHPPFLLGMIFGMSVIYWFTGASTQAVITGAYRAVAFIKRHMNLDGSSKASVEDSKRVVAICTRYAQLGMFNIFLTIFFTTLAASFVEPFFFVGYLIGLALSGLFQAIFMANAGGAWDNAKKIVETDLREKGTELHAATVVGDTVGDPFKDTSSVAMNPIIKFATLFGLLAVELAQSIPTTTRIVLAALLLGAALVFVHRSFYGMRIDASQSGGSSDDNADELVGAAALGD
ncbi:sodium-translocating pyrophosphatase [Paludisphaera borealis]|uniref:K(+)-insensitive pyrophosphate-energized proton pump n=1 Tax=Paludisphaera borealis TaxID=1387353 RepID=A0A1U7CK09_9BACT|nr:sodium-translocating pyrophosphatase [Paludisphaera borealis]APW59246.1 K(+)-stimulated pyrophosphate-energized sodium pump [Paludisphaera borealis]